MRDVKLEQIYASVPLHPLYEHNVEKLIASAKEYHPSMNLYDSVISHFSDSEYLEMIGDNNKVIDRVLESESEYPKMAIMYIPRHFVLLNFKSESELEVFYSLAIDKKPNHYQELKEWCDQKKVKLTCQKRYIQQPRSAD
jgi:hypothetical protein